MSMAIRIVEARNGKSRIAFSGYHSWQDWYIAANLKNKKFKQPSFKRFSSTWNPKELKGTVIPFTFDNFNEIKKLTERVKLSAIVIECGRYNYLSKNS